MAAMRAIPSAYTVLGSSHQKASGDIAWRVPVATPPIAGPRRARSRPLGRLPGACSGWVVAAMLVIGGSFMSSCYRDAMSRRGGVAPGESPGSPAGVRRGRSAELERGQFGAGAEAELAEHVAQVEVDGAGAEEQLCGGVPVGQ